MVLALGKYFCGGQLNVPGLGMYFIGGQLKVFFA
jgi:hypothetical protein